MIVLGLSNEIKPNNQIRPKTLQALRIDGVTLAEIILLDIKRKKYKATA